MIQIRKLKKLKNNFPVLTGNKVLSKKLCDQLIKEIQDSPIFDDTIMGGSSRINKGSKNFKKYLKKAGHTLLLHGRYTCKARSPSCKKCVIIKYCKYNQKELK